MLKLRSSVVLLAAAIAGCSSTTSCETPDLSTALLGDDTIGDVRAELVNETEEGVGCKATLVIDSPTSSAIDSLSTSMLGDSFKGRIEGLARTGASVTGLDQWQMRESVTVSYVVGTDGEISELNVPTQAMDKLVSAVARASLEKDNEEAKKLGYLRVSRFREHRQREEKALKTIEVQSAQLEQMQEEVGGIKSEFLSKQKLLKEAGPKLMHLTGDVFRLESDLRNTISFKGGDLLKASDIEFRGGENHLAFYGTLHNKTNKVLTEITVNALLWSELTGEGKEINLPIEMKDELPGYGKMHFELMIPKDDEYRTAYAEALIQGAILFPIAIKGDDGTEVISEPIWTDPREDIIATQKAKTVTNNEIVSLVQKMQALESDIMTAKAELKEAKQVLQDIEHERPELPMHAKKS